MISRLFLSAVNSVVNFITIIALLLVGSYAIYSLWDNNQILMEAENVQEDIWFAFQSFNTQEEPCHIFGTAYIFNTGK